MHLPAIAPPYARPNQARAIELQGRLVPRCSVLPNYPMVLIVMRAWYGPGSRLSQRKEEHPLDLVM
ncbi:hypothetical protein PVAP13_7NG211134 [Panicum virgatum]|uniref:Uncharacterized protein n=1 Tax=Panicum virgatum TaxID=38727 RepID=A0A8T0PW06_PANVG|nr:hypothetical protein PVAP13_7NG211134 [Panicum virgatum]